MPRNIADLQRQIEELVALVERQNERSLASNEQIAALQAAAAAQAAAPPAVAQIAPANNNSRIPDLIRMVPEFSGNPRNLPRWIESVEEKLTEARQGVPENDIPRILPIWMGIIRDKITEKANDALSASHTPLEWDSIKATLIVYFGDKSDLSTLMSKLTSLKQGSQSVLEFYQNCRSLLAEINAKVLINNNTPNEARAIMGTYETLMTNAFVDGLHDAMSDLTRSTRPQSLTAAFQVASDQEAAMRRRRAGNSKQLPDASKPKMLSNTNAGQQNRPYAHAPVAQHRPFFSQMPQYRHFAPQQMVQPRSFQRSDQPGPNPANQQNNQLTIKQEPKSHTGLKPPYRQRPIHMHEQYYDYYGYPPCTSQWGYLPKMVKSRSKKMIIM